jgi:hypothetical protein
MAPDDDQDDLDEKKVKELISERSRADLERWFGLPSFEQLAEEGKQPALAPEDPEMVAVRERREKALAAVDPALLEEIHVRTELRPEALLGLQLTLDVHVDPDIAQFDERMVERAARIADPREVEISEELRDDLKECVPQALLRDLHRPETDFDKTFELVDVAAEQRFDIVAEVQSAMRTSWALPPLARNPFTETRELLAEVRRERKGSWPKLFATLPLSNRKVQE